jgi:D-methionine transport system substrate-binding protein
MTLKHLGLAVLVTLTTALPLSAEALKIGVVPGAYADAVNVAAEEAKTQGLEVEVIEFSDWNTPNIALDAKDIDLNFFQHKPFLENVEKEKGFKFAVVAPGILQNIGLYSLKHKSLDEVPEGGSVAIADDPVNQGRGLLLLQAAGLIKLKDGVGFKGTVDDIIENPKNLKFTEVPGPQLVNVTPDVDLAQGYPIFIVAAKAFDPTSGLIYTGVNDLQFNVSFVSREGEENDPRIQQFIKLFQSSQAVKDQIHTSFAGSDKLYVLAWEQK